METAFPEMSLGMLQSHFLQGAEASRLVLETYPRLLTCFPWPLQKRGILNEVKIDRRALLSRSQAHWRISWASNGDQRKCLEVQSLTPKMA